MKLAQRIYTQIIATAATLLLLAACGGGGGETPAAAPAAPASAPPVVVSEVPNPAASAASLAAAAGGEISASASSAIKGTKVKIPADAALDAIVVELGYEDAAPGPFRAEAMAAGLTQVSKTVIPHVSSGGPSTFNRPVTITIPYDTAAADGGMPVVLYWDEDDKLYRPVAVTAVDRAAGTVSFVTSHFSRFVAIVLKALKLDSPSYDTGFKMGVDSILHQNFGSYEYGGHCMAFASIASNYFSLKKAKHLYEFAQEGSSEQPLDDELTRSALAYTYGLLASKWRDVVAQVNVPSAADTGKAVLAAMMATGQPVHFSMRSNSGDSGHSVTVFGYDATHAAFKVYDSNFPKEELSFEWNQVSGFGKYSKAALYGSSLFERIGYFSDDTFGAPRQFKKIISDWESGKLKDYFANLTLTDTKGTARPLSFGTTTAVELPYEDGKQLTLRFNRPAAATGKYYAHVYRDGVKEAAVAPEIAVTDEFTVAFAKKLEQKAEVAIMVSNHPRDPFGAAKAGDPEGFAAYGKFTAQAEGKNFFVNFGFEKGALSGWNSGTITLNNNRAYTPTKVLVMGQGLDPIATDLPTVLYGHSALRVNDSDPNYHATTVSQKATVPSSGNAQLKFSWAAVLQDPQHTPQDQPYVDVRVRNNTKGMDIYYKRFYTADPAFSGWRDYQGGAWKAIPWQQVLLTGLGKYAGDEIELIIQGADCGLGGHGGYVYLDGEE